MARAFTSKERDAETGLDYFGARYFSSAQGRFTSPDWSAVPSLRCAERCFGSPASGAAPEHVAVMTTYAYSGNTVKVTDPAGKWKTYTMDSLGNLTQVPKGSRVAWNAKAISVDQHHFDHRPVVRHRLRLYQREPDRLALAPQPFPPRVEARLTQLVLVTENPNRLATFLLLCNPLAPQLAPFHWFLTHLSNMHRSDRLGQWGSCDAYSTATFLYILYRLSWENLDYSLVPIGGS